MAEARVEEADEPDLEGRVAALEEAVWSVVDEPEDEVSEEEAQAAIELVMEDLRTWSKAEILTWVETFLADEEVDFTEKAIDRAWKSLE